MIQYLTQVEVSEIKASYNKEGNRPFPFGPQASFLLSNTYHIILDFSDSINAILESDAARWKHQMITDFFESNIVKNHRDAAVDLFNKSIELLRSMNSPSVTANLEFNIKVTEGKSKRVMLQYCQIKHANQKLNHIVAGHIVDISHLIGQGSPRLVILRDNVIQHHEVPVLETILKSEALPVTQKELNMLALKAQGMRGKEIAEKMGITLLTVYSMTRDIKQKSKMDIFPLIQKLKDKGLLRLYCGNFLFEEFTDNTLLFTNLFF